MKLLLVALNAKYIHTNIAIRYLKHSMNEINIDVDIAEFTINHRIEYIVSEIYKRRPKIIGFSTYIWNVDMIHRISKLLKKIMPELVIILGGPEVSFDVEEIMKSNDSIDIIVIGEGEKTFPKLVKALINNWDYSQIDSIAFRAKGKVYVGETLPKPINLDELSFPYQKENLNPNKIVYYESSRGCPFQCQYCLSSRLGGVRFRSLELVKEEILYFIEQEIKQVKFIDRTFNANKSHAMEIMDFIVKNSRGKTNFHFEIVSELVDNDMLGFLSKVPAGLFQFEIGVQSTNPETLKEIQRKLNFNRLTKVVHHIRNDRNIHLHLDLIAGLPKEDYFTFRKSFDDVFFLRPDKLQLGFLKLLRGSGIRERFKDYGYIFDDYPPYELLENNCISYTDIVKLKGVEKMLELYWNNRMFRNSIYAIINNHYRSPFRFFEDLSCYWEKNKYHHKSHGRDKLYNIIFDFYKSRWGNHTNIFKDILKLDYLKHNKTYTLPSLFRRNESKEFTDRCHKFLQKPINIKKYLPDYHGLSAKQIIKNVHFERFDYNIMNIVNNNQDLEQVVEEEIIILFDYRASKGAIEACSCHLLGDREF